MQIVIFMIDRQALAQQRVDSIQKPLRIGNKLSELTVSKLEIMERFQRDKKLEELGISTSKFDGDDGKEDPDELEAIILINRGEALPKDLEQRLKEKNGKSKATNAKRHPAQPTTN